MSRFRGPRRDALGVARRVLVGACLCVAGCAAKPEAVSLLGQDLYPQQLDAAKQAELEADRDLARERLEEEPDDEMAIIWYGRRLAYLGEYREAIGVFTEGLEKHPSSYKLLRHRGHRWITVREFDKAVADLSRAATLIEGKALEVEPDGAPNAAGIPRGTTQTSIYYHLGLAYYLQGDFEKALVAYQKCLRISNNDDMWCATAHWNYMTLRRLGRQADADKLTVSVHTEMEILENFGYHKLLLMYKAGEVPEELEPGAGDSPQSASVAYGIGNWYLYTGRPDRARAIFEEIVKGESWPSFGHIAAEADLAAMAESTTQS